MVPLRAAPACGAERRGGSRGDPPRGVETGGRREAERKEDHGRAVEVPPCGRLELDIVPRRASRPHFQTQRSESAGGVSKERGLRFHAGVPRARIHRRDRRLDVARCHRPGRSHGGGLADSRLQERKAGSPRPSRSAGGAVRDGRRDRALARGGRRPKGHDTASDRPGGRLPGVRRNDQPRADRRAARRGAEAGRRGGRRSQGRPLRSAARPASVPAVPLPARLRRAASSKHSRAMSEDA